MRPVLRATLLLFTLAACGPNTDSPVVQQCIAQCEAASECPEGIGDCDGTCVNELAEAQRLDCEVTYQALLDCIGKASDPCDTSECAIRVSAYSSCEGEFCGTHPEDPICSEGGSGS